MPPKKVNQVLPALQISKASGGSHFIFSSFKTNIIATKRTSLKVSIEGWTKVHLNILSWKFNSVLSFFTEICLELTNEEGYTM